jgi:hypothetical protein
MSPLKSVGAVLLLVVVFLGLFSWGAQVFLPIELIDRLATHPSNPAQAGGGMLVMAALDVTFMLGVVVSSRLHGARLWLLTSALYWCVKTFTGQLEAWYFMPNISASMVPALMAMTLPVALVVPLLTVVFFERWRGPVEKLPWQVPAMSAGEQVGKWVLLSALVYPALFFLAGYYIAFSSEDVRAFYGGVYENSFLQHMRALLQSDPLLLLFEMLRGVLWVGVGVAVLWTTRGRLVGGLLVLLLFTLVQNDVHLIPNPLMPPVVQRFHFIETVSSNAVFAVLISWLMSRVHFHASHHGPEAPRLTDSHA